MGRYVINAGHETLAANDKVILYMGYDCGKKSINRHICMADANAIKWELYSELDQAIITRNTTNTLRILTSPGIRPWWCRVVAYLQLAFPDEAPLTLFTRAWLRSY